MTGSQRYLFRAIVPAYPKLTIYTNVTGAMTALGPLSVATAASKLEHWDVEVVDENNCPSRYCPKTRDGYPNHSQIQADLPADVIGLYGSMSSSVPKLYNLAALYHYQGALVVAGGKHIEFLPEEALDNGVDVAVIGEGEETIKDLLLAWEKTHEPGAGRLDSADRAWWGTCSTIQGIVFRQAGATVQTAKRPLNHNLDALPFPDFNLLRYGRISIYPVNRTRGCNSNCEFCTVKDQTRTASPLWLARQVIDLVENRGARKFFDTSDHFAANREEAIEFCHLIADYQRKHGLVLDISVQTRITDARYPELLRAMKDANIRMVAIGYESPIDEELLTMNKGYLSKDMVSWSRIFHQFGFYIHGMMIFGYPVTAEHRVGLTIKERVRRFRNFIHQAKIDTVQVLLAIPFAGTGLRRRLELANRVFPLSRIGWEYYDGQFPLFEPDDGSTPEENMRAVVKIMGTFYNVRNLWRVVVSVLFHFPRMFILPLLTLVTFRVNFLIRAFRRWNHDYFRNNILRFGGAFIVKKWKRHLKEDGFLDKLHGLTRG